MFRDVYVAARSWETRCRELFTSPFALGSLGDTSLSRHRSLFGACRHPDASQCNVEISFSRPSRGLRIQRGAAPVHMLAPWRGAGGGPRGELSGDYIAARSWESWCSDMFTLPLALGRLGVENCLRHRSLLGALVLRACRVTVRCWEMAHGTLRSWEPWC